MQRRATQPAPIRTATRILAVLVAVNRLGRASLTEIAREVSLPVPTVLRLLRSLCTEQYVERDTADGRYMPAARVVQLSSGYDEDAWITASARPLLEQLGDELRWPLSFAMPFGLRMSVRLNTDRSSPLAIRRYAIGMTVPMLASAAGLVYLAYCDAPQRQMLLDALRHSGDKDDYIARDREAVRTMLARVRRSGYAIHHVPRRVSDLTTVGVPVIRNERIIAVIVARFARSAVPDAEAVRTFVPSMQATAAGIAEIAPD